MAREHQAPLLAWVCTAALVHLLGGGGADQVSRVLEDRAELREFARSVRGRLRPTEGIEVTLLDEPQATPEGPRPDPSDDTARPDEPAKPDDPLAPKPEAKKPEAPRPEPKQAEPKPEPPKPEPKKVVVLPAPPAPPPPPPQPMPDQRIAVKQHAEPNQQDNPEAKFIADEANRVAEESVSQITSHDQDDPNPTPGGHHLSASKAPGNSEEEHVGDSDEHRGDPTHAPGEASKIAAVRPAAPAPPAGGPAATKAATPPPGPKAAAVAPAPSPPSAGGASQPSPDAVAPETGPGWRLDPARQAHEGPARRPGATRTGLPQADPLPNAQPSLGMLGLNGTTTPGGINLNLTQQNVVAVVGEDNLRREREADGERRRSAHRGSWKASSFERWRPSIENYVASVKPGNQTALNTAAVPFASYLNAIHNRIHPLFADEFLSSLDELPQEHPMNQPKLVARLEIVLSRDDGRVVKMGIVRTSGVTAFDIAALDSVQRGSPYGKAPGAIVSPDGNVYFHWEFWRDPIYACSTMHARPFLLDVPPASPAPGPASPPPARPFDPREQGAPPPSEGSRQGRLGALVRVPRDG